uniref:Cytochrome P450 n=1 Tax=Nostoc sp. UIC 10110 TaxID=1929948 RepID=A0A1P8YWJ1_9NOSO|nr:cytochrome P450 [Nostoc sp. UIC 10110]
MTNKLPEGPNSPSWWQLIRWIEDPLKYEKECVQRYGDIYTFKIPNVPPFVVIGNPVGVQEILSQHPDNFDVGRGNYVAQPVVGDNSLFLYDGERHQRERKLLMPPFHGQNLQSYAQSICNIAIKVASQWKENQRILARQAMQNISLEVILKVVFGISEGERYQKIKPLLAEMLDAIDSPFESSFLFVKFLRKDWGKWSPWGRMKYRRKEIYKLLQEEINERRSDPDKIGNDVLSLMMSATDKEGEKLTDSELKDELMTLLFTGHETTASMLSWAFYEIFRHPDVLQKLRDELEQKGENQTSLEIAKLPYLNAVCQEVLRMYPVLALIFPRITKKTMKIMGYQFVPGTWLTISAYLVHHREDLYPEPEKFQPERFLEKQFSSYEYFPFGGGSRRCLGYALAELEMKLVLASIISKYELTLESEKLVKPLPRGLTISPAGGVPLIFQRKRALTSKQLQKNIA